MATNKTNKPLILRCIKAEGGNIAYDANGKIQSENQIVSIRSVQELKFMVEQLPTQGFTRFQIDQEGELIHGEKIAKKAFYDPILEPLFSTVKKSQSELIKEENEALKEQLAKLSQRLEKIEKQ